MGVDARAGAAKTAANHQPRALLRRWRKAGVHHAEWRRDALAQKVRIGLPAHRFDGVGEEIEADIGIGSDASGRPGKLVAGEPFPAILARRPGALKHAFG